MALPLFGIDGFNPPENNNTLNCRLRVIRTPSKLRLRPCVQYMRTISGFTKGMGFMAVFGAGISV